MLPHLRSKFILPTHTTSSPSRIPLIPARYAGRGRDTSDPRRDILRSTLYPANVRQNKSTPTGSWRPDVARALKAVVYNRTVHETIERAWLLHQRHVRKQREEETSRKFESMKKAMTELEKVDRWLADEANRKDDPTKRTAEDLERLAKLRGIAKRGLDVRLPGLFPRDMRIPTDTPPKGGWDHDWKAASN